MWLSGCHSHEPMMKPDMVAKSVSSVTISMRVLLRIEMITTMAIVSIVKRMSSW